MAEQNKETFAELEGLLYNFSGRRDVLKKWNNFAPSFIAHLACIYYKPKSKTVNHWINELPYKLPDSLDLKYGPMMTIDQYLDLYNEETKKRALIKIRKEGISNTITNECERFILDFLSRMYQKYKGKKPFLWNRMSPDNKLVTDLIKEMISNYGL